MGVGIPHHQIKIEEGRPIFGAPMCPYQGLVFPFPSQNRPQLRHWMT